MRLFRASLALAALALSPGCGYIHFGRLPRTAATMGDTAMAEVYTNLATEHKILKQELVLARREGDTLRTALERGPGGSPEIVARLNDTTRELAALRASYAKLQAERSAPAVDVAAARADLEEKLAASLRNYTQLQEENSRLRTELTNTRAENTTLADQLKSAAAQNEQAQSALAQLNTELLAQKEARGRAEQAAAAVRAQLGAIVAARDAAPATLATSRESSAAVATGLQLPTPPVTATPPTAELRTNPARVRPAATEPPAPRIHVVEPGDTLEKIARKYYGEPQRWSRIYAANNELLRDGRPLKPGMELEIPPN